MLCLTLRIDLTSVDFLNCKQIVSSDETEISVEHRRRHRRSHRRHSGALFDPGRRAGARHPRCAGALRCRHLARSISPRRSGCRRARSSATCRRSRRRGHVIRGSERGLQARRRPQLHAPARRRPALRRRRSPACRNSAGASTKRSTSAPSTAIASSISKWSRAPRPCALPPPAAAATRSILRRSARSSRLRSSDEEVRGILAVEGMPALTPKTITSARSLPARTRRRARAGLCRRRRRERGRRPLCRGRAALSVRGRDEPQRAGRPPAARKPARRSRQRCGAPPTTSPKRCAMPAPELARMTWRDAKATRSRDARVALVPVGSTEQHGPHMTLDTDSAIAEAFARRLGDALGRRCHPLPDDPAGHVRASPRLRRHPDAARADAARPRSRTSSRASRITA